MKILRQLYKWFNRTFCGTVRAEDSISVGPMNLDEYFVASQDLEQEIQNHISKGIHDGRQLLP